MYNPAGIFIIDKPADITSAGVVRRIRKMPGILKAGHTGTLDPFATGVIICCVNRATRLATFFLGGNKKYDVVMELGVSTDTQDFTGNVIARSDVCCTEETIRSVFKQFQGRIEQLPPVYSALKHHGTPLYKLARRGTPVQKDARMVEIYSIYIQKIIEHEIWFEVSCSAGTYIRTLCSDIGLALGCGGHLKQLRRTQSSGFTIEEAIELSELEKLALSGEHMNTMISMADALRGIETQMADSNLYKKIRHGIPLTQKDIREPQIKWEQKGISSLIKIVDTENNLLAVLNFEEDRYKYCCVI